MVDGEESDPIITNEDDLYKGDLGQSSQQLITANNQNVSRMISQTNEDEMGGQGTNKESKVKRKKRSYAQIMQSQIDDGRETIKKQIEENLKLQRDIQNLETIETKIQEGMQDLINILEPYGAASTDIGEQSSLISDQND